MGERPAELASAVDAIIDSGVSIVETAGGSPKDFIARLKAANIKVQPKCTSVRHARSAQKHGVDIVCIDGFECATHPGEDDIPALVLPLAAVRTLKIPVIASGGIGDGRGVVAALATRHQHAPVFIRIRLPAKSSPSNVKARRSMRSSTW